MGYLSRCSRDDEDNRREDTRILLFLVPPPLSTRYFFRPFCSNRLIASTRIHEDVSLSKSGEGNADDEWHSEEEMKVACRPGIYIFPRVTRLMIRLYAVARTRASRHFFQSGRRCWETRGQRGAFSISSYFRPIFGKIRSARGDEESDMIIGRWIFIRWNCRTEGIEIDTWIVLRNYYELRDRWLNYGESVFRRWNWEK